MRTAILTDTNSGITREEGKKQGIFVIPMPVIIDSESYLEGEDITHRELYECMRRGAGISSSQPSPGAVMEAWDEILQDYDELVYIPMSSGLSESCHNAVQMALDYNGRVQVADNHRISVTLRESVLDAQHLAECGKSAAEIKKQLEEQAYDASIYITVNTMEYLKKGGRVTPGAAALATVLNIKPVLTIQGDKLDSYAKIRGMKQAERKMLEAIRADLETRFSGIPQEQLRLAVAGTFEKKEEEESWRETVQAAFPRFSIAYTPLSCSIACHTGMNAAGVGIVRVIR